MKFLTTLLIVISVSSAIASPNSNISSVRVLSTKSDIFYYKVDKSLMGAVVEVYSQGILISTDTIMHQKNIIDFYLENSGTYQIKITKDGREEEFTYEKTEFLVASKSTSILTLQP